MRTVNTQKNSPNIYAEFSISTFYGALAGVTVYLILRLSALATDHITKIIPLSDSAPSDFLSEVLNWSSATAGALTFVIVTIYQIIILIKRMTEGVTA